MFNHEIYAASFARAVHLVRDRHATREQQESALRALVALSDLGSAALRVYGGGLSVDDVSIPPDLPHVDEVIQQLEAHGLAEVMLGKGAEPHEILALLVALAEEPGGKSVKEHLRDARSRKIMVILGQSAEEAARHRPTSVAEAFAMLEVAAPEERKTLADWEALHARSAAMSLPEIDLGLAPAEGAAPPSAEQPGVAEPAPAAPASEPVAAPEVPAQPPLEAALTALARDPYGRQVLDRLTTLTNLVTEALREDRIDDAVRGLSTIVALEPGAPEGTPRNSFGIALRRTLTRDVLAQIAPHALDPRLTEEVAVVMRRGYGDAAEILLGLLANAEAIKERRAYMQILRSMPQGVEQVVHMLDHHQWFVVRNVAELMGEARVEESVPQLSKLLAHRDNRVQRAAAVALAKIGTPATVEPLRRTLKDGSPELRSLIAMSIGPASRALAMPLVSLAEAEENDQVRREFYHALGRIGTPDAVQALTTAAQPGGRLVGRKPSAQRVAAVEGLQLAGAAAALVGLASDGDKAVREAVARALREFKKGDA